MKTTAQKLVAFVLTQWHSRIKRNPSNTEVFQFLDDLSTINHNESVGGLLYMQFGIPEDLAEAFILEWKIARAI